VLPAIVSLSALANFAVIFGLFLIFLVVTGNFPGVTFLAIIPLLIVQLVFAIGLGITLGVLNVFFRDVSQFMSIILQFWFWFTPIVYPVHILPDRAQRLLVVNPMADLVLGYQAVLVHHQWPEWGLIVPVFGVGLALCFIGMALFRRHAPDMVDEL
jgi:lipopolysaccharide transport system permease protein